MGHMTGHAIDHAMDRLDSCILHAVGRHCDPWSFDNLCIAIGAADMRPPRCSWTGLHDLLDAARVRGARYLKDTIAYWNQALAVHGLLRGGDDDFALLTIRVRSRDRIAWMCASEDGKELVSCAACPLEHADSFDLLEDDHAFAFKATFRIHSELIELAAASSGSVVIINPDCQYLHHAPLYRKFEVFCAETTAAALPVDLTELRENMETAGKTLAREACDAANAASVNLELQVAGLRLEAGYRSSDGRTYAAWHLATRDGKETALLALTVDSVNYIEVFGPPEGPKRLCATRGVRALDWSPRLVQELALAALWIYGWPNTIINATFVPVENHTFAESFGFTLEDSRP